MSGAFVVREVEGAQDIDAARQLILAHAAERSTTPGVDGVRADAARLPGPYIPPRGALWLAAAGTLPIGCVALRPMPGGVGEVKRMFVDPGWRGRGVGRALMERLIEAARLRGYRRLRLGTLLEMQAAQALYRSLGFVAIERYREDEHMDSCFFELDLTS